MRLALHSCLILLVATAPLGAQGAVASSAAGWNADLDTLVARITRVHPRPWAHTTREAFDRQVAALRRANATATDGQRLAGMMRLVASLEDGHTFISDLGPAGTRWYPVRFYLFADGLHLTAVPAAQQRFAGAKVLRVGTMSADSAVRAMLALSAGDNEFGRREGIAYLSSAVLARALGVTPREDELALETDRGVLTLAAVDTKKGDVSWAQYGELYGPPDLPLVTAFGGRAGAQYRDHAKNGDLPVHLRGRRAYWWTVLPADSAIYFGLGNIVAKSAFSPQTLLEEIRAALAHVDSAPEATKRFILDLRYDSGGDGTLTPAIVNEFVKRDASIGRRGRFFVITGRKTFSAAAGTVLDLLRHTNAILVGEPMGVAYNSSGDAGGSTLPAHGIGVSISTNTSFETRGEGIRVVPVQVPGEMTGADYFAGRDPAVDQILAAPAPYPDVPTTLREQGGVAARALWAQLKARHGAISWWEPFTYGTMNSLSYDLLAQQRTADAVAGFELNAERFPERWEVWDSLGDGLRAAGRKAEAKAAYERALRVAPDNWNAEHQRRMIAEP